LNILKATIIAALLVSGTANATGLPPPDFSKWASNTLHRDGITDAKVIETKYPFSFTYCLKDSATLWRYDEMSAEQIAALKEGRIAKPATQKSVAVERDSDSCKAAS
jgi:hypothetical protein